VDAPSERLLGHSPAPEVREALALVAPVRAVRLPAPPEDLSLSAMNEWAREPFSRWVQERLSALRTAEDALSQLASTNRPAEERALAAAASGAMYEDFVRDFLSVPLPSVVTGDRELLGVYAGAILEQARALANTAHERYLYCRSRLQDTDAAPSLQQHCERAISRIERAFPFR
jgi:hypothetical protein